MGSRYVREEKEREEPGREEREREEVGREGGSREGGMEEERKQGGREEYREVVVSHVFESHKTWSFLNHFILLFI